MMSLTCQLSQAVGASQAPGCSASANMRSACWRTTRRIVGLPSYVVAFHSLMACSPDVSTTVTVAVQTVWRRTGSLGTPGVRLANESPAGEQAVPEGLDRQPLVGQGRAVPHRDELADRRVPGDRLGPLDAETGAHRVQLGHVGLRPDHARG